MPHSSCNYSGFTEEETGLETSDARARAEFNPDYLTSFKPHWYPGNSSKKW